MTGTVHVPIAVSPLKGHRATLFTITWAAGAAPSGFVYYVEIRRPGERHWKSWETGVTSNSHRFKPDAGVGRYRFRARLRKVSIDQHSNYSIDKSIDVR